MDPKTFLIMRRVRALADASSADMAFDELRAALEYVEGKDDEEELALALELRDREVLSEMIDGWSSGRRKLPAQDQAVFKRAMKAFRKRLKLMRLDDESTLGGSAMSSGRSSAICGVSAPETYPDEVWHELVYQGRLVDGGDGLYELPAS